jgi:hypothetical protein
LITYFSIARILGTKNLLKIIIEAFQHCNSEQDIDLNEKDPFCAMLLGEYKTLSHLFNADLSSTRFNEDNPDSVRNRGNARQIRADIVCLRKLPR